MASSGTTIPVLLPVTATVVSNVTLLGSAAIASSASRLPDRPCRPGGKAEVPS
jgi:hypothetical protein